MERNLHLDGDNVKRRRDRDRERIEALQAQGRALTAEIREAEVANGQAPKAIMERRYQLAEELLSRQCDLWAAWCRPRRGRPP